MPIENQNAGAANVPASVASPEINVGETGYDVNAMMEASIAETDAEENGQDSPPLSDTSDDDEDTEASYGDEDSDDSDSGVEAKKIDPNESIKIKAGDKEIAVPKDGEVEVKINGKVETMSLQEALNKASGNIHVERETARLGRERKEFHTEKETFHKEAAQVNANAEALLEMQDPYELCEYICELKGGDPEKLFEEMIANTLKHLEMYRGMTPRERQLANENRKFKRMEKARTAEKKTEETQQQLAAKRVEVESSLTESGFNMGDFNNTLSELHELIQSGKEAGYGFDDLESPTEEDVINYMIAKDLDNRVISGIKALAPKLSADVEFVNKVKSAIIKTETLHGKMSPTEVNTFLKEALKLDNKALSENLNKKVSAKGTNSKLVNSHEQEDDADEGFDSLDEMMEASRSRNLRNV